jgi:methionyl-tRNA synthetase
LLSLTLCPIVPIAAGELWRRLGYDDSVEEHTFPNDLRWGALPSGASVKVGEPLFPRLDTDN